VGGHFFAPANGTDPWIGANGAYYSNVNSNTTLNQVYELKKDVGADVPAMVGRTFVVHDSTGARIGCGVLSMTPGPDAGAGSVFVSVMMMAVLMVFGFLY